MEAPGAVNHRKGDTPSGQRVVGDAEELVEPRELCGREVLDAGVPDRGQVYERRQGHALAAAGEGGVTYFFAAGAELLEKRRD